MDDMLGLLFFPRMNWIACNVNNIFLSSIKGPYLEGQRLRVCAMDTVSHCSVADPGCLFRIRLFSIPDPGSELSPKKWFLSCHQKNGF
jgi:hypothetical protein